MCMHRSLFKSLFSVPLNSSCRIAWSYGSSMFHFLRNYQSASHSAEPFLHSRQQHMKVLLSPHLPQLLSFSVCVSSFSTIVILVNAKYHLIVLLICIYLMNNDVEHLFICLLAICITSLEKCLFRSFAPLIGLLILLLLSCSSLYSEY